MTNPTIEEMLTTLEHEFTLLWCEYCQKDTPHYFLLETALDEIYTCARCSLSRSFRVR